MEIAKRFVKPFARLYRARWSGTLFVLKLAQAVAYRYFYSQKIHNLIGITKYSYIIFYNNLIIYNNVTTLAVHINAYY